MNFIFGLWGSKSAWKDRLYNWADKNGILDLHLRPHHGEFAFYNAPYWSGLTRDKAKLDGLTELNLSSYELTELPREIENIYTLEALCLASNELSEFPEAITMLKNLACLDVTGNQFEMIPSKIGELSQLKCLDLSSNKLTGLPSTIEKLKSLSTLGLSHNFDMRKLPISVGQLTSLTKLYLSHTSIKEFPSEIIRLRKLSTLTLSGNGLLKLPAEIGQLNKLEYLGLESNDLQKLPIEIGQLTNLKELHLPSNNLTEIPLEIGQLANLKLLDISGNNLTELPPEICQLTNLTEVRISNNKLTNISQEIREWMESKLDTFSHEELFSCENDYTDDDYTEDYYTDDDFSDEYGIEYIYHITHYTNVKLILTQGLRAHGNEYVNKHIDNQDVNQRRNKIEPIYNKNLHSYVPFYFNPKNPMLYVNKDRQDDIVILAFDRKLMFKKKTIFSDGNAAKSTTNFYSDLIDLEELNWDCLNANYWSDFENGKSDRMAEVLVPNKVKVKHLKIVFCFDEETKSYISDLDDNLDVEINKNLYFN